MTLKFKAYNIKYDEYSKWWMRSSYHDHVASRGHRLLLFSHWSAHCFDMIWQETEKYKTHWNLKRECAKWLITERAAAHRSLIWFFFFPLWEVEWFLILTWLADSVNSFKLNFLKLIFTDLPLPYINNQTAEMLECMKYLWLAQDHKLNLTWPLHRWQSQKLPTKA